MVNLTHILAYLAGWTIAISICTPVSELVAEEKDGERVVREWSTLSSSARTATPLIGVSILLLFVLTIYDLGLISIAVLFGALIAAFVMTKILMPYLRKHPVIAAFALFVAISMRLSFIYFSR